MKKLFLGLSVVGIFLASLVSASFAMDTATYKKMAKDTIKQVISGSISDIDKLIAQQEKMIEIGLQGCLDYAEKSPKNANIMKLVIQNSAKMKTMTLDDLESAWHEGEFLKENGFDVEEMDHFSAALGYVDSVVVPATTYVALKEYKRTKDGELLSQVKDELAEVLEHMGYLE